MESEHRQTCLTLLSVQQGATCKHDKSAPLSAPPSNPPGYLWQTTEYLMQELVGFKASGEARAE